MMIRVRWGIATALTLAVAAGFGLNYRRASAQYANGATNPYGQNGTYWSSSSWNNPVSAMQASPPAQGYWAEIINATSKWIVVQNQAGQQFPISSDRVRQFLVRWRSTPDQINGNSLVEVIGPDAGSNVIIAGHIDFYEDDAQKLVTPTYQSLVDQDANSGDAYFVSSQEYAIPGRKYIVGHPTFKSPLQIGIPGNNVVTIQPSTNGMTVTQITLGNNSYAKPGDLIYIIPENATPRSLDVTTLVLYKQQPFRRFQP